MPVYFQSPQFAGMTSRRPKAIEFGASQEISAPIRLGYGRGLDDTDLNATFREGRSLQAHIDRARTLLGELAAYSNNTNRIAEFNRAKCAIEQAADEATPSLEPLTPHYEGCQKCDPAFVLHITLQNPNQWEGADLRGIDLSRCTVQGSADPSKRPSQNTPAPSLPISLQGARLENANLTGVDLSHMDLRQATYNPTTRFPEGFAPQAAGMILTR